MRYRSFYGALSILALALVLPSVAQAQAAPSSPAADRVIVVSVDGVRWQEMFGGAVAELVEGKQGGAPDPKILAARFLKPTAEERRETLMPFLWQTVARHGQIFGDAMSGSPSRVTNGLWFSYPGYNEMLTGAPDPRVNSNDKLLNPNLNVLEFLNGLPRFKGSVQTVGSWDVLPYILNAGRGGLPVNFATIPFEHPANEGQRALNAMAADMPAYWEGERFDAVTMQAALETLRTERPRVMYVLLGDTDEWAHERRYDLYLDLVAKSDRFIRTLWETAQSMPDYRGRTALVVVTDHGRGASGEDWTDHGRKVPAAERVWVAVMGPGVMPLGVRQGVQTTLGQVAATVAALVGEDFRRARPGAAAPLPVLGQMPSVVDSGVVAVPRRPETQAVVEACRAKGREAETRHTLMVFRAAQEILKVREGFPEIASADLLTTEVATMLHDIGGGGLVNARPGAVIAGDVLTSLKERQPFTDAFIAKVSRIVETHHVSGTIKGKDDGPEWFVVLLADTPRIYNAPSGDRDAFGKLLRERIDQLKAAIQ